MNKHLVLACTLIVTLIVLSAGCRPTFIPGTQEVSFEQLFSNAEQYNEKEISLEGFYFDGFEVRVIAESLKYSGYAEAHLIPEGRLLWVEGSIPPEIYERLYRQSMMGPEEHYGKVRATGTFEYGERYGHLGGYEYQIVLTKTELLPWSISNSPTLPDNEVVGAVGIDVWGFRSLKNGTSRIYFEYSRP